jgi:hypothetical protein
VTSCFEYEAITHQIIRNRAHRDRNAIADQVMEMELCDQKAHHPDVAGDRESSGGEIEFEESPAKFVWFLSAQV